MVHLGLIRTYSLLCVCMAGLQLVLAHSQLHSDTCDAIAYTPSPLSTGIGLATPPKRGAGLQIGKGFLHEFGTFSIQGQVMGMILPRQTILKPMIFMTPNPSWPCQTIGSHLTTSAKRWWYHGKGRP